MVAKQIRLTEIQNRALKRRAKELGVSESEVVRRILSEVLLPPEKRVAKSDEMIEDFFALADEIAKTHRFPEG